MPAARDLTNVDILAADSNKKEQNIEVESWASQWRS